VVLSTFIYCILRLLDARVRVSARGDDLTIRWEGGDNPVWMTGPAVAVFEGEIEIDES
jgi:diaminopimelate epimerase